MSSFEGYGVDYAGVYGPILGLGGGSHGDVARQRAM